MVVATRRTQRRSSRSPGRRRERSRGVKLRRPSDDTVLVAMQGPRARDALAAAGSEHRRRRADATISYRPGRRRGGRRRRSPARATRARTASRSSRERPDAASSGTRCFDAGRSFGVAPIGLGARDTLRLEAGMPLYGNEIDRDDRPARGRASGRVVKLDKPCEFVGRAALERVAADGPAARAGRSRRRGPRHRPPWLSGPCRRAAGRDGDQRDASPTLGSADRDGLRRTERCASPARCSMSRSATRASPHGSCRCRSTGGVPDVPCPPTCTTRRSTNGSASTVTGDHRASPSTPPTSWATSSSSSCRKSDARSRRRQAFGVVESVKAVSDLFAPVGGEVVAATGARP